MNGSANMKIKSIKHEWQKKILKSKKPKKKKKNPQTLRPNDEFSFYLQ